VGVGKKEEFQDGHNTSFSKRSKQKPRLSILVQVEAGCKQHVEGVIVQNSQGRKNCCYYRRGCCASKGAFYHSCRRGSCASKGAFCHSCRRGSCASKGSKGAFCPQ